MQIYTLMGRSYLYQPHRSFHPGVINSRVPAPELIPRQEECIIDIMNAMTITPWR
jgi:hypothetical protein